MKYFFVLGSNPTLSIAEISAFFGLRDNNDQALELKSGVLIFATAVKIDVSSVMISWAARSKSGRLQTASRSPGPKMPYPRSFRPFFP